MSWAEVSPFLGILLFFAWCAWLMHRENMVESGGCHRKSVPKETPPPPESRIPHLWESRLDWRGGKPTPKESGELPQPGDR